MENTRFDLVQNKYENDFLKYIQQNGTSLSLLLKQKIEMYLNGSGESVPLSDAEVLLDSIIYILELAYYSNDEFLKQSINTNFDFGQNQIMTLKKASKRIVKKVIENTIMTKNMTYNTTIHEGLPAFFTAYDPTLFAQYNILTYDYPLFLDMSEGYKGIEKFNKYTQVLLCEHLFCSKINLINLDKLLKAYHEDADYLVINLFEFILVTALILFIGKKSVSNFKLTADTFKKVENYLKALNEQERKDFIKTCLYNLYKTLKINEEIVLQYLLACENKLNDNIAYALDNNHLDKLILITKQKRQTASFEFSYGETMDNRDYQELVYEINSCRFEQDKKVIIEDMIKTLSDFENILIDTNITTETIELFIKKLDITEFVALRAHFPFDADAMVFNLSAREQMIGEILERYLLSLNTEKQAEVKMLQESMKKIEL